ncbi:MAG: beta-lactamase family protein [Deltaproteobacteria bacterium]|nr:beta-lactamase family protein [Deltaproteobacteria bacterium]
MVRFTSLLVLASFFMPACGGDDGAPTGEPTIGDRLQAMLDQKGADQVAPGATLTVTIPGEGLWVGATGMADVAGAVATTGDHMFGIGSVTKTFTAAVVLQLRDEAVLSLDDYLEDWYPGFPRGEEITLRHLLSHQSGIYDSAYLDEVLGDVSVHWDPNDLVALAGAEPPQFSPGHGYDYSNTNFILLGLVTEAATGNTWESEVRTRLLDPVGLGSTFTPTAEDPPGGEEGVAHGYFLSDDWTLLFDPSAGYGCGAMVASGPDLVTWLDALLFGTVLSPASQAEMQTPSELIDGTPTTYGLGLRLRSSDYGPNTKLGHSGDAIIYRADAFHLPQADVTVVALTNGRAHEARPIADAAWEILTGEEAN